MYCFESMYSVNKSIWLFDYLFIFYCFFCALWAGQDLACVCMFVRERGRAVTVFLKEIISMHSPPMMKTQSAVSIHQTEV